MRATPRAMPSLQIALLVALPCAVLVAVSLLSLFLPTAPGLRIIDPDLYLYREVAGKLLRGEVLYRDFAFEYPPLAALVLIPPYLVSASDGGIVTYGLLFLVQAGLLSSLLGLALIKVVEGWTPPRAVLPVVLAYTLLVGAAAPLLAWRYDLFPAVLTALALVSLLHGRPILAGGWLGLGTAAKLYPAVLLLVVVLHHLAGRRYRAGAGLVAGWAAATGAILLPFLLLAPGAAFSFLGYHQARGIQVESTPAGLLMIGHLLGWWRLRVEHSYGAFHLAGPPADVVAPWLPPLMLLALGAALVLSFASFRAEWTVSGQVSTQTLLASLSLVLLAFLLTSKVFSPQYLAWLLPFAPLLRPRQAALAVGIVIITMGIFPLSYDGLVALSTLQIVLLNLRNLLVVALAVWLVADLKPSSARAALTGADMPGFIFRQAGS